MRKNINIIIAALAAASAILLSVSCQKQERPEIGNDAKVFSAVIEQGVTKTTLTEEYKVNWVEGDEININGAVYSATPQSDDATKATFTKVSGDEPSAPYAAIYPETLYKSDGNYEKNNNYGITNDTSNSAGCIYDDDFREWRHADETLGYYQTLEKNEWEYLIGTNEKRNGLYATGVTVMGIPDSIMGYWSSTPISQQGEGYSTYILRYNTSTKVLAVDSAYRYVGLPVRLVMKSGA